MPLLIVLAPPKFPKTQANKFVKIQANNKKNFII